MSDKRKLKLAGVGCGGRTETYMGIASGLADSFELVAAADPIAHRCENIRKLSSNPEFRCFDSDIAFFAEEKMADIVIIGTQDEYHVAPCIAALEKGYDVLLEKPIAQNLDDVLQLETLARKLNRRVLVCHVLRYDPMYRKAKEIIDSGMIGDVISLNAVEGVGAWHQCHSFVRGKWAKTEECNPMIIAKSCHDTDIISWLIGRDCQSVSSFGSLSYFCKENAPEGSPERCTDGCPISDTCPYNTLLYLTKHKNWLKHIYDFTENASDTEIIEWLSGNDWGRCVFRCDNTAVDHQVLAAEFDRGVTATFTMTAFEGGRRLQVYGTKGKFIAGGATKKHTGADIVVTDHGSGENTEISVEIPELGGYTGHGGADTGLVLALYEEMTKADPEQMHTSISSSIQSHAIGFAAEQSRLTGKVVNLPQYIERHR